MSKHDNANIICLSASPKVLAKVEEMIKVEQDYTGYFVGTVNEAKHILVDYDIDLILIDGPLPNEDATKFAMELAKSNRELNYSIVLLNRAEEYEANLYQTERMGIVTYRKPMDPHVLMQTMRMLLMMRMRIKKLESKADKLQQKIETDRLVSRAKILLVAELQMSEQDAHYYIERKAMDACVKKIIVAQEIIDMYES